MKITKTKAVWDLDILLRYFERLRDNTLLTNLTLTKKLILQLLLLEAHKPSTICMFTVDNMTLNDMSVTLLPNKVLKHSRKGRPQGKLEDRIYKDKSLSYHVLRSILYNRK